MTDRRTYNSKEAGHRLGVTDQSVRNWTSHPLTSNRFAGRLYHYGGKNHALRLDAEWIDHLAAQLPPDHRYGWSAFHAESMDYLELQEEEALDSREPLPDAPSRRNEVAVSDVPVPDSMSVLDLVNAQALMIDRQKRQIERLETEVESLKGMLDTQAQRSAA